MNYLQRTRKLGSIVLLAMTISLAGCASSAKIMSDYDKTADFGSYKTYNFVDGAGPDYGSYQSLFTKYVIAQVTIEMENRGYTKAEDPDLLVNFGARLDDKIDVRTSPSPTAGGYYGYRSPYGYGGWGGYGYATETHVSQYTEGTYNIDIIDAKRQQLVWEAVGIGRVTDKKRENLEETVTNGVRSFFAGFPFVAGNPNPVTPN
ncbi:MAG: DUF4136 domain-containing protein [Woeseiaceae bacterium]